MFTPTLEWGAPRTLVLGVQWPFKMIVPYNYWWQYPYKNYKVFGFLLFLQHLNEWRWTLMIHPHLFSHDVWDIWRAPNLGSNNTCHAALFGTFFFPRVVPWQAKGKGRGVVCTLLNFGHPTREEWMQIQWDSKSLYSFRQPLNQAGSPMFLVLPTGETPKSSGCRADIKAMYVWRDKIFDIELSLRTKPLILPPVFGLPSLC